MLPITLTIAAAATLINVWLGIRCAEVRRKAGIMIGDGANALLGCRMRAQANFVENAPFVLILLALVEYAEGPLGWLWAAGIVFIAARILHPLGMDRSLGDAGNRSPFRAIGMVATWGVELVLAAAAISIAYSGHR